MNFGFLTLVEILRFDNNPMYDEDYEYYVFGRSDGEFEWRRLPEYDNEDPEKRGIVKMYDEMIFDDNATYTIKLLKQTYDELSNELTELRKELDDIVKSQNFLQYLN